MAAKTRNAAKTVEQMQTQLASLRERASLLETQLTRQNERASRLKAKIYFARKRNSAVPLRQVALMLHVSGQTAWRMVRDGRLKGFQGGSSSRGWWWVTKRSIRQLHEDIQRQSVRRHPHNVTPA